MRFVSKLTMTVAAIFFALSVSAQEVKENSSDTRLMKNVVTLGVLENGMVLHDWEWNDTAIQLSPKYGLSVTEGGYPSEGLIAQDVEAIYPDAVVVDADGYLVIDIPMLAEQDELIAKMVMEGGADVVFGGSDLCSTIMDYIVDEDIRQRLTFMDLSFNYCNVIRKF